MSIHQPPIANALVRLSLAAAFVLHGFLATAYGWLSPKGFPVTHPRFWLNTIVPLAIVVVAVTGVIGMLRGSRRTAAGVAQLFAATWLSGSLTACVLFPESLKGFWQLGVVVAIVGFVCSWWLMRDQVFSALQLLLLIALGSVAGIFSVWAQVPEPASTLPLNFVVPDGEVAEQVNHESILQLDSNTRFDVSNALLFKRCGSLNIECDPLLNFDRISPDGFWSLFAPPRNGRPNVVSAAVCSSGDYFMQYDNASAVQLSAAELDGTVQCTAWTQLPRVVHTHLNTFCTLLVHGHSNLSLAFSPCPDVLVEVLPADYPTGRPARFAYLTEQQEFRVVEATSGEKGPFTLLATGVLRREEPLSIHLYDNHQLQATLTLYDWTSQLSTAISPTAGWGVPQNSIQFRRSGDRPSAAVEIYITLAGTGIGRGWEVVGHGAGIYRNRLTIKAETDQSETK